MEKLIIKPFAIIYYQLLEGQLYGILRYNTTEQEWQELSDIFTNKEDAQSVVDELNQKAGNITIILP